MRGIALLFITLTNMVISSSGQTDLPKHYCQGCSGGVGVYYLKLDLGAKFEAYYLTEDNTKANSSFGLGKFNIKNDVLTLSFENVPEDGVDLKKISNSDSLIIHFNVFDNIHDDSVALTNVKFKSGETFFYTNSKGTIKMQFSGPKTIEFSSLGFRDISHSMKEPGEYEMKVRLNPEGKTYLKQGDKREFKVMKKNTVEWFQGIDDNKLKFTTIPCGR